MNQSWEKAPTATHSLHTAHPVRRIAWRPDHPTELLVIPLTQPLSSSNSLDPALPAPPPPTPPPPPHSLSVSSASTNKFNISTTMPDETTMDDDSARLEIWHVRRHYIAKYAIPSQDGVAVDASWRGSAGLVVTFQNGGFAQLDIPRKLNSGLLPLPLDQIPRQIAGWSAKGDLYFAIDKFRAGEVPFDDLQVFFFFFSFKHTDFKELGNQSMQITMNVSVDRPIPSPTRPTSLSRQSDRSRSPTPTHPNSPFSPAGTALKAVYLPICVRGIGMWRNGVGGRMMPDYGGL